MGPSCIHRSRTTRTRWPPSSTLPSIALRCAWQTVEDVPGWPAPLRERLSPVSCHACMRRRFMLHLCQVESVRLLEVSPIGFADATRIRLPTRRIVGEWRASPQSSERTKPRAVGAAAGAATAGQRAPTGSARQAASSAVPKVVRLQRASVRSDLTKRPALPPSVTCSGSTRPSSRSRVESGSATAVVCSTSTNRASAFSVSAGTARARRPPRSPPGNQARRSDRAGT